MDQSLNSAGASFRHLTDEKVGLIKDVRLFKNGDYDPKVFCAIARLASLESLIGFEPNVMGSACGVSELHAIIRASGECIERYASSLYSDEQFFYGSQQELKRHSQEVVPIDVLYPFSREQHSSDSFPYSEVHPDTPIFWVDACQRSGVPIWVPASSVYVPYRFKEGVEPFTHMPISTGLAAGRDMAWCIEKGFAEIVERDALMIRWKAMLSPALINLESCLGLDPSVDMLLGSVAHLDADWYINLLTTDIEVPVISAALVNKFGRPLTSFGISADIDPVSALKGALQEACLSRFLLNRVAEIVVDPSYIHVETETLRSHLLAHATSIGLRDGLLAFLECGTEIGMPQIAARFSKPAAHSIAARVEDAGLKTIWRDVTTADIAELGFVVVRCIVPFAEPLDTNHKARHLGGRRLLAAATTSGISGVIGARINSLPHPFP